MRVRLNGCLAVLFTAAILSVGPAFSQGSGRREAADIAKHIIGRTCSGSWREPRREIVSSRTGGITHRYAEPQGDYSIAFLEKLDGGRIQASVTRTKASDLPVTLQIEGDELVTRSGSLRLRIEGQRMTGTWLAQSTGRTRTLELTCRP